MPNSLRLADEALVRPLPDSSNDYHDQIVSSSGIAVLLIRLIDQQRLLEVRFMGDPDPYTSALLELVPEKNYMVLDALVPVAGHRRVDENCHFRIRAQVDDLILKFGGPITDVNSGGGAPYYRIPIPEIVHYARKRKAHRVHMPPDQIATIEIEMANSERLHGELKDLSVSGFCASIHDGPVDRLDACSGNEYAATITLSDGTEVNTWVEFVYIDNISPTRPARLGAKFRELTTPALHAIEHNIARVERALMRRR